MSRLNRLAALVDRFCRKAEEKRLSEWLDSTEVCQILQISPRTLQTLRDNITALQSSDLDIRVYADFTALANKLPDEDLCLIYIDAHLDIHTPESSRTQASGAPHGTNIRALMGDGDARWLSLQTKRPALRPENIFYLGARSYEPAEINFVREHNIYMRSPADLQTPDDWVYAADEILHRLGTRPYVVSFDFDAIDPNIFPDVLVPEKNGLSAQAAEYFIRKFAPDAHSFEFVEYAPSGNAACTEIVKKFVGIVLDSD